MYVSIMYDGGVCGGGGGGAGWGGGVGRAFMCNARHCRGHWHESVEGASQILRSWFGGYLWGWSSLAQRLVTNESLEQCGGIIFVVANTWFRKLRVGGQKRT